MVRSLVGFVPLMVVLTFSFSPSARMFETEHYRIEVETLAEGLSHPWSLAWLPDGRMLVTERGGRLRIMARDGRRLISVAGLPRIASGGQGGLLDILVDPDFPTNQRIYFSFSEPGPEGSGTAVARARLLDGFLRESRILFRQHPKASGGYHFGSRLALAQDGSLFVTVGERGEPARAQDPSVNRGQVIRIRVDGSVPVDNPFVGQANHRPEIWSYGHRNPQGAALHPETGTLWIHEHGARGGDEINIPRAGANHGWPVIAYGRHYSGAQIGIGQSAPGLVQPIYYWDPSIAPSGMVFYTGAAFPKWRGNLLVGALKSRLLVRLELEEERIVGEERLLKGLRERVRDVRQGPDGLVYLLTDAFDGRLLRLKPVAR